MPISCSFQNPELHRTKSSRPPYLACGEGAAANAETNDQNDTPERINVLVTYGEYECPEAEGNEIVVRATRPESERYRIPKELREVKKEEAGKQS